jgi:Xaa-Pro aminopeptidase
MQTYFGPDFFTTNRDKLRAQLGSDVAIVVTGNGVMQRGGDEPSPFYQDSNFWYLSGLNAPDLTLAILGNETFVIVPELSSTREAFDGAHDLEHYAQVSGIASFMGEREGWQRIRQHLQTNPRVATLGSLPIHLKQYGIYSLPFRRQLLAKLKRMVPNLEVTDIRAQLASLRVLKQPEELLALQEAIDITTDSLQSIAAGKTLSTAEHEYQLEAALTYEFRFRGSEGHAFAPIIGAGQHGVTLHHMQNDGPITNSDLIVLDVGASVSHYSADITRTVSRTPLTGRQAEVFRAVETVQDYALSLIKPGVLYRDYEKAVEAFMGEQLQKLGLIKEATREAIRHYYPHATSHFLGLDTHDAGDYHQPLEAGMVLTCEPGIYIPEEGIGVRIEDDILVTPEGNKNLSAACPRRLTPVQ